MPNYENIKPYSDFNHEAAQHGGIEKYLDELEEVNYQRGLHDGHENDGVIAVIAFIVGGILVKCSELAVDRIKEKRRKKKEELIERSNAAEEAIKIKLESEAVSVTDYNS